MPAGYVVDYQRPLSFRERAKLSERERAEADRRGWRPRKVRNLSPPQSVFFPDRRAAEDFRLQLRADEPDTVVTITYRKAAGPRPVQFSLADGWPQQSRQPEGEPLKSDDLPF